MTVLVELCAGSAALSRQLLGAGRLLGYKGGKDGYAPGIISAWCVPVPDQVVLNDLGLWGVIWPHIHDPEVGRLIAQWSSDDPRALFDRIKSLDYSRSEPLTAAAALCRLAGTYGGGEVGGFKGRHKLRPNVDGFIPNRKTLAERVGAFRWGAPVASTRIDAAQAASALAVDSDTWVYIDPPYVGTSGYLNAFDRDAVVAVASDLFRRGARVAVSEGEVVQELTGQGWSAHDLTKRRRGQGRKDSRSSAEWLHVSPV